MSSIAPKLKVLIICPPYFTNNFNVILIIDNLFLFSKSISKKNAMTNDTQKEDDLFGPPPKTNSTQICEVMISLNFFIGLNCH